MSAPDDADEFCIDFRFNSNPSNVRALMDSFHYINLLPPHGSAVWQRVDNDENNAPGRGTEVSRKSETSDTKNTPKEDNINLTAFIKDEMLGPNIFIYGPKCNLEVPLHILDRRMQ